jgi:hypothetical protein
MLIAMVLWLSSMDLGFEKRQFDRPGGRSGLTHARLMALAGGRVALAHLRAGGFASRGLAFASPMAARRGFFSGAVFASTGAAHENASLALGPFLPRERRFAGEGKPGEERVNRGALGNRKDDASNDVSGGSASRGGDGDPAAFGSDARI